MKAHGRGRARSPVPAAASRRAPAVGAWPAWAGAALAVLAGGIVYRRVLQAYFSPDDFLLMARARDLVEVPVTVWRFLSGPAYWTAATRIFGGDPVPYHAVMWLVHGVNTALVFLLARRLGGAPPVALLGAGLFATSRIHFNALYPASSIGEVLALALALGGLLMLDRAPSRRAVVGGSALMAAALLCKESVALLPLAWIIGSRRVVLARRLAAATPALAAALLLAVGVALTRERNGPLGGEIYAWSFGSHLFENLAGYTGAALDLSRAAPDPAAAGMVGMGTIGLLVLAAAAVATWRRTPIPACGLAGWILGLAPVLPLENVRYAHYTYAPLAFLGLAVASLALFPILATGAGRRSADRPGRAAPALAPVVAVLMVLVHAAWSEAALAARHAWRMEAMDLPQDSALRKMEFARRVIEGVRAIDEPAPLKVAWVMPTGTEQVVSVRSGRTAAGGGSPTAPRYNFAAAVLDSGRAVRAVLSKVSDIQMVERWSADLADYVVVSNRVDGRMTVHGRGPAAHASLAVSWWRAGLHGQAESFLASAIRAHSDPGLVALHQAMRESLETRLPAGATAGAHLTDR